MRNIMIAGFFCVTGCSTESVLHSVTEDETVRQPSGNGTGDDNVETITVNTGECSGEKYVITGNNGSVIETDAYVVVSPINYGAIVADPGDTVYVNFLVDALCGDVQLAEVGFEVRDSPTNWSLDFDPDTFGDAATLVETTTETVFPDAENGSSVGLAYYWCDGNLQMYNEDCSPFSSTVNGYTHETYQLGLSISDSAKAGTYYAVLGMFIWYDVGTGQKVENLAPELGESLMTFTVTN